MRVLHLLKTGIGARWALHQVQELIHLGIDAQVALPAGPMVERFAAIGAKTHLFQSDIAAHRPWHWPKMFASLHDLVDTIAPDVIHSHFVGTTVTMRLALKSLDIPRVFQVPGPLHLEHPLYARAELAFADGRDHWIAACRWTKQAYHAYGIAPQRVSLSYNTTDVSAFTPRSRSGGLRQALHLKSGTRIAGMVAYLYPPKRYLGQRRGIKGHEDFIDAIARCRAIGHDVVGVVVGGAWGGAAWYESQIHAYATRHCPDGIHFLGLRNDVNDLYTEFDVAVHPSLSENVGGALESSLMAVPTIATSVGGFPDLVIPNQTGWLVPPASPIALAEALSQALADDMHARQLAANARELALRLFSPPRLAREIRDIYRLVSGQE
ncbi:MAG: glycosyltransferase family 4 protein [Planctomycetes bacterium]|nr:glycosyltransferase family 4 protein [Planctomycetota bacterium]